ncbi:hypothetical protein GCM10010269_62180 [Streptomyces humidus]|uniref:Uncharacterized protein n=1 Tax=Streptomyces humidus TaxID=52259 RepID=A0A918G320_9ACTN|nr:hypothetical protein [Streptomyces humidus]GGS14425.1 hypothetical protein GCM10010269_62180 [Streptomyces humidus]
MSDKPSEEHSSGSEKGNRDGGGSAPEPSSSISDEEWAKFVQDSERAIPDSAPKEPSARARMVTERLRRQEERGELPQSWRYAPSWQQETQKRATRKRRLWAVIGLPVAAVLAVVAMRPSLLPGDPFGAGGPEAAVSPLPAETAAPTGAPGAVDPETPTLDRPFAGSPALAWADGAAGIVLPEATPVATLSAAEVEKALQRSRKLLIDANLDPATLRGERPGAALSALDPRQKDLTSLLETALRKPDEKHDPLSMFSRFDPRELRMVGDVVKTRGRMTFKAGEQASVVVHADYTFVYPVTRVDEHAPAGVARTIVRRVLDLEFPDPDKPGKYAFTPGRITVLRYDRDIGNSACDVYDGFLHPGFSTAGTTADPTGAAPTGPTADPYDRSRDLAAENGEEGCGVASRT